MPTDVNSSTSSSSTNEEEQSSYEVPSLSSCALKNLPKEKDHCTPSFDQKDVSSSRSSHPDLVNDVLGEWSSLPIIGRFISFVLIVNLYMCRLVPMYAFITGLMISVLRIANNRLEEIAIFRWTRNIVEKVLKVFLNNLKDRFPSVYIPSWNLLKKIWLALRYRIIARVIVLSSYGWSQRGLRTLDHTLRNIEHFLLSFVTEKSKYHGPWWALPAVVMSWYRRVVNRVMKTAAYHIHTLYTMVRSLRRSGHQHILKQAQIRNRRKVSPRKCTITEKTSSIGSGLAWLANKILLQFGLAQVKSQLNLHAEHQGPTSPNRDIPSDEKKRKLSDISEGGSTDAEGRAMTHRDLLKPLDGYISNEDPDYIPSDSTTTDSYEYKYSGCEDIGLVPDEVDIAVPSPSTSSPATKDDHMNKEGADAKENEACTVKGSKTDDLSKIKSSDGVKEKSPGPGKDGQKGSEKEGKEKDRAKPKSESKKKI